MLPTSRLFAWDLHKARKLHKDNKGHQAAIFNANHAMGRNIKRNFFYTTEMFHAVRKTFPFIFWSVNDKHKVIFIAWWGPYIRP